MIDRAGFSDYLTIIPAMASPRPSSPLARLVSAYPRELATLALLGLAAAAAVAGMADARVQTGAARIAAGPVPVAVAAPLPLAEPLALRPVAAQTALELNAALPVSPAPNPAARPFATRAIPAESRERALECLTSAIYYEAGSESPDGQRAVAQVVLNRVRHPAYPASICGAVYQGAERPTGCQFTFTCDGSLLRRPTAAGWQRARRIAEAALGGAVYAPVGNATHYHSQWVLPYWSASLVKSAVVGAHIFYRWSGGWGRPAAFSQSYSAREPDPLQLREWAIAAGAAAASSTPQRLAAAAAADPLLRLIERKPAPGGERIVLRIASPNARAVAIAARPAYVERMDASANLRWTLGGEGGDPAEQVLGRPPAGASGSNSAAPAAPAADAGAAL